MLKGAKETNDSIAKKLSVQACSDYFSLLIDNIGFDIDEIKSKDLINKPNGKVGKMLENIVRRSIRFFAHYYLLHSGAMEKVNYLKYFNSELKSMISTTIKYLMSQNNSICD